jgi:hypothetical protein
VAISEKSRDSGGQRPESGARALKRRRSELAAAARPGETWEQVALRIVEAKPEAPPAPAKPKRASAMPAWPETLRCVPNEILRSALFNARNRNVERVYLQQQEIAVLFNGRITFTGWELRQDDETVWLQLIHLARQVSPSAPVEFTPKRFCEAVRWSVCEKSYVRLRDCLTRMQANSLGVYSDRLSAGVSLSMIPKFEWQDMAQKSLRKYRVQVAPELVALFDGGHFSRLEWQQRLALPVGIATWLHGYFSTHKEPFPVKLATIQAGCGISVESPKKLRDLVAEALSELVKVGFLESFEFANGLVCVRKANHNT